MAGFEDLEVWKKSCNLTVQIYNLFGDCNDFSLKDQITRAAMSVPSNIAEGSERQTKKRICSFSGDRTRLGSRIENPALYCGKDRIVSDSGTYTDDR